MNELQVYQSRDYIDLRVSHGCKTAVVIYVAAHMSAQALTLSHVNSVFI